MHSQKRIHHLERPPLLIRQCLSHDLPMLNCRSDLPLRQLARVPILEYLALLDNIIRPNVDFLRSQVGEGGFAKGGSEIVG